MAHYYSTKYVSLKEQIYKNNQILNIQNTYRKAVSNEELTDNIHNCPLTCVSALLI